MSKREITKKIAKDAGITLFQAQKAYAAMLEGIKEALCQGDHVTFSGFGSFEVKIRAERKGRNPKTGEVIPIPPKKRVKFTPSRELKKALQ
ncbi:MAG: HU family DNA-binding protein [Candidatus Aminicenantes bacterium]|nr:HU family DNA-binding protein [Candidatus Aminicenantes bacterium]